MLPLQKSKEKAAQRDFERFDISVLDSMWVADDDLFPIQRRGASHEGHLCLPPKVSVEGVEDKEVVGVAVGDVVVRLVLLHWSRRTEREKGEKIQAHCAEANRSSNLGGIGDQARSDTLPFLDRMTRAYRRGELVDPVAFRHRVVAHRAHRRRAHACRRTRSRRRA